MKFRLPVFLAFFLITLVINQGIWAVDSRVKIGFLVKMPEENWFQKEWQFADLAGHDLGFDVVKIGVTDGEKVLGAIDSLAAQGAQGFVICSPDPRLGPAILARASVYRMKVLTVDDQLTGSNGAPILSVPYLGISARGIGQTVGSVCWTEMNLRRWKTDETAAIALSFRELETATERVDGAAEFLVHAGFHLNGILDSPLKTTDVEGGFTTATVTITKNPKIKHWLIFGINDETVLGGVQALEGRGFRAKDVIGVGINGMALAVSEFKKSSETGFFASILLDPRRHGYDTAAMLYQWIVYGQVPPLDTRTTGTIINRSNFAAVLKNKGLGDLVR